MIINLLTIFCGGASTLVDDSLGKGFKDLTVFDISAKALEKTQERLGNKADYRELTCPRCNADFVT